MFVWSVTITKEKIALLLAILLLFTLISGVCITFLREDSLRTNQGRIRFLEECGLLVESSPFSVQTFKIPKELDAFYSEYEALQNKQGLSLMPYRNQTVKKYTYPLVSQDGSHVVANLFLKGGVLIACDLTCPDFKNGWIKPLLPEKSLPKESVL
ncbi:MAG: DUF4830 domain-containing protein [Clostridia bacterium]|nr:DUF4830 domain-containing protein [Clostridia bacterium]